MAQLACVAPYETASPLFFASVTGSSPCWEESVSSSELLSWSSCRVAKKSSSGRWDTGDPAAGPAGEGVHVWGSLRQQVLVLMLTVLQLPSWKLAACVRLLQVASIPGRSGRGA